MDQPLSLAGFAGQLRDRRLGIVGAAVRRPLPPTLPSALRWVVAEAADGARFGAPIGNRTGSGCAWWDAEAAGRAAVAEAIERYCGNAVPAGLERASFAALQRRGVDAVDPAAVALHAPEQYARPRFPFCPLTRDTFLPWAEGVALVTGARRLVPASLAYLRPLALDGDGRAGHAPLNAGIATGATRVEAEQAALEEAIERDALARAWLGGERFPRLTLPRRLADLLAGPGGALDVRCYLVPNRFDLPVIAVTLSDRTTGYYSLGAALRPDPGEAVLKAASEAAILQVAAARLDDPDDHLWEVVAGGPLASWRPDRRYHSCHAPDWSTVTDLLCHVQLYLDPAMQRAAADRLSGGPSLDLDGLPAVAGGRAGYLPRLEAGGYQPVSIDLTTADVRAGGLTVVRVVVPRFISTTAAAYPLLGAFPGPRPEPCLLPLPHA